MEIPENLEKYQFTILHEFMHYPKLLRGLSQTWQTTEANLL